MARKKKPSNILEEEVVNLSKERTILSKERTILSFMQTGLAFIGVGIVVINIFGATSHPSELVGWVLVVIGFAEVLESLRRLAKYRRKMSLLKRALGHDGV
jgi:uncharacterized membrane protein YidH (DUF202 family)